MDPVLLRLFVWFLFWFFEKRICGAWLFVCGFAFVFFKFGLVS